MRKGAVQITQPSVPAKLVLSRALILQILAGIAAQVGAGEIGDEEVSDVSFAKLVSGALTGEKELILDGEEVVLKSNNYVKDERRFVTSLFGGLSKTIQSLTANFTAADVGRPLQGEGLHPDTTIASVTSPTEAVMSHFSAAPAVDVEIYMPTRPAGAGQIWRGDGSMELGPGTIFRGILEIAGFKAAADGTITIGVGDFKMTSYPDGRFVWGKGGAVIGITAAGELFAGGEDETTAIVLISSAGDLTVKNTSQSMHSIPLSALVTTILAPTFDPPGGAFDAAVDVAILDQEPNVAIYYTTDGSTPDDTDTLYTGARIHLVATTTVKAIAYIGPFKSAVSSQTFTNDAVVVPNPTADPVGGDYSPAGGSLSVDLSCNLAGASMRYTTDGSTPSDVDGTLISPPNAGTIPSGTVVLPSGTRTLKVIAFKTGKTNSGVVTHIYDITSGGAGAGGSGGGGRGNVP